MTRDKWGTFKITGLAKIRANRAEREIVPEPIEFACTHTFQVLEGVYGAEPVNFVQRGNTLMCVKCSNRKARMRGEPPRWKRKLFGKISALNEQRRGKGLGKKSESPSVA